MPGERTVRITVSLSEGEHRRLKSLAMFNRITPAELLRDSTNDLVSDLLGMLPLLCTQSEAVRHAINRAAAECGLHPPCRI